MIKAPLFALLALFVGCSASTGGGRLTNTKHESGSAAATGYLVTDAVSKEDIKVGDWVYFYENGNKEKQGSYAQGKRHGAWTFWLSDGSSPWIAIYENGEGPRNGMFVDRYDNGQKRREGTSKNGNNEGSWTYWHKNGQKSNQGAYKDGKAEGVWTFWDDKGAVTKTANYRDGKVVE
jgi:antitoxin component YwqK of YwqJK toxin-antitoxin module